MVTKLVMSSKDQYLRRPSYHRSSALNAHYFTVWHSIQKATSVLVPVFICTIVRPLNEGQLISQRPLLVLTMAPTHHCLHLKWCCIRRNWTEIEWKPGVFSEKTRFNLGSDDNRACLWRPWVGTLQFCLNILAAHCIHSLCDGMV